MKLKTNKIKEIMEQLDKEIRKSDIKTKLNAEFKTDNEVLRYDWRI